MNNADAASPVAGCGAKTDAEDKKTNDKALIGRVECKSCALDHTFQHCGLSLLRRLRKLLTDWQRNHRRARPSGRVQITDHLNFPGFIYANIDVFTLRGLVQSIKFDSGGIYF
jgi:hypothetical protein